MNKKTLKEMKKLIDAQGLDGTWNYDNYMHGLYNGMELMFSMVENREPNFRDAPKIWKSENKEIGK